MKQQRRFPIAWAIFAFALVSLGLVYFKYFPQEVNQMDAAYKACPSDIQLGLTIAYDKPPFISEVYEMRDNDGVSSYSYAVEGVTGKTITITAPQREILDVSFLAGKLDQDHVRSLSSAAPAGDTSVHYTLTMYRKEMYGATQCRGVSRTIAFTDPHYWATRAGREFHLNLSKGAPKSASDLVNIQSTSTAEPRYQMIVDDFRSFGSDKFHAEIAAAQARIRAGK